MRATTTTNAGGNRRHGDIDTSTGHMRVAHDRWRATYGRAGEVVFAWSYGVVLLYAAAPRATQRLVLARNAIPVQ